MKKEKKGRGKSGRGIQPLADALAAYLRSSGVGKPIEQTGIERQWRAAVGDEIGEHSRAVRLTREVLEVEVDSSALLQELSGFHLDEILESLRSGPQPLRVADIRFRVAAVPRGGPSPRRSGLRPREGGRKREGDGD